MSDPDAPPLNTRMFLEALDRHKVAYVAVGGLAAQWQGASRPTKDMDICPAWDNENLDRLAGAMRDLNARLKVPGGPPEGTPIAIESASLRRMEIGTWRTDAGDIDILLGIPRDGRWDLARYEHLRENAATLEIGGKTVVVASLADIVRSKEIANRPPDPEALPELRELRDGAPTHDDDLYEERGR